MHARLDQLLSLRDGTPVDAEVRTHVQQCAVCAAEAARLAQLGENLRALPAVEPPRDFWQDIEARAAAPRRRYSLAIAASVAVFVLAFVGYHGSRDAPESTREIAHLETPSEAASDDLTKLIAQSRELEAVLQYLPERPQIERVSTAITVDSIERRIQWLDWQLANGSDAQLDRRQAERLWSERVDLMDSLVKVRYAESAPMVF